MQIIQTAKQFDFFWTDIQEMYGRHCSWFLFSILWRKNGEDLYYWSTPGKISMEPENTPWKRINIFQTIIFRFYVNLGGCSRSQINPIVYGWRLATHLSCLNREKKNMLISWIQHMSHVYNVYIIYRYTYIYIYTYYYICIYTFLTHMITYDV